MRQDVSDSCCIRQAQWSGNITAGSEVPWTLSFLGSVSYTLETPCPEQAGGEGIDVPGVFSQRLFIRFVRILFTVSSAISSLLPSEIAHLMRPLFFHLCHRALWQLHTPVSQRTSSALSFSSQSTSPAVATYHLQRALPGGIVLMELAFQVRKNKKQSMIFRVSSKTVFRGDKGSDEECSRGM